MLAPPFGPSVSRFAGPAPVLLLEGRASLNEFPAHIGPLKAGEETTRHCRLRPEQISASHCAELPWRPLSTDSSVLVQGKAFALARWGKRLLIQQTRKCSIAPTGRRILRSTLESWRKGVKVVF